MRKPVILAGILFIIIGLSDLQAGRQGNCDSLEAVSHDSLSTAASLKSSVKHFIDDHVALWTSPLRLKRRDLPVWGAVLAGTAGLIACDEAIQQKVIDYRNKHPWVREVSPHISRIGEGEVVLSMMGLFYAGGLIFKNDRAVQTGKLSFQAFLHTGIIIQVLKHLTGRQRPYVENGEDCWHGPLEFYKRYQGHYGRYSAFPSGHAAVVWSLATVIAEQYKNRRIVPILCYSLATLCSVSRITKNVHWSSDAFFGSAIGFGIGKYIVRIRSQKVTMVPVFKSHSCVIQCSYDL